MISFSLSNSFKPLTHPLLQVNILFISSNMLIRSKLYVVRVLVKTYIYERKFYFFQQLNHITLTKLVAYNTY